MYGQTGIVFTPVATLQVDRKLTVGWQYVPADQAHLKYSQKNDLGENVYYARLGFLPWAEASIRLVHPDKVKNGDYGIGDRSIFLKFQALREKKFFPAIAIGVYDPFGTRLLPASYVVATKSFPISTSYLIQATTGYGLELFEGDNYLISGLLLGCQILPVRPPTAYWPQWTAGVEYNEKHVNMSAGILLFSIVQINAYLIELQDLSLSVSASIGL
ncbi:MAG: YjbH domain-containing protein [Saprospiraceae bacterium]|nr:YjbH domain-containing protein [Saprospiraceae bacterium]